MGADEADCGGAQGVKNSNEKLSFIQPRSWVCQRHNSPCHFNVGEHPTITKQSCVFYKKARTFDAINVDAQLADGQYVRQLPDYPLPLVNRIIEGAKMADDLTLKFLDYLV
jgi:hypothetical protein